MNTIESSAAKSILKNEIAKDRIAFFGAYTSPKTWGVYEIEPQKSNRPTRRFRIGNHPIRQRELEIEFGAAACIAIFPARVYAEELERLLNNRQVSK